MIAPNVPAQHFWREVVDRFTRGRFVETALADECWHGPLFSFDNTA